MSGHPLHEAAWVGVDGCPAGWVAVGQSRSGAVQVACVAHAAELFSACRGAEVVGIDMPIGLADAGVRETESVVRRLLGPRRSSVFNAPPRACLAPGLDYRAACAQSMAASGRKLSKQSFFLLPKIGEVDRCLVGDARLAARVWEVHPELSFTQWAGGRPMAHPKHTGFGFADRLRCVESEWPGAAARARAELPRSQVGDDDLLDAFAALWSARRIARGEALAAGDPAARDAHGLRMCIHA